MQIPAKVFYSYAPADKSLHQELEKHLSSLRQQGMIEEWHTRQIAPGTDMLQSINEHLVAASIILLLISPDFIASDYYYSTEMQKALARSKMGEAQVIPILLRPVDWEGLPFGHLQCLPSNEKPVTSWPNLDEAFQDIVRSIRLVINGISPFLSPPSISTLQEKNLPIKVRQKGNGKITGIDAGEIKNVAIDVSQTGSGELTGIKVDKLGG